MQQTQITRLGNLIGLIADRYGTVSMTKLLKLLFIIDRESIKKTGIELTSSVYKVWEKGPVNDFAYNEIRRHGGGEFTEYINVNEVQSNFQITSTGNFNINIFSRNELNLVEHLIKEYHACSAEDMINELHEEGTLWHNAVVENNLKDHFNSGTSVSDVELDFKEIIKEDQFMLFLNNQIIENNEFSQFLGKKE